MPFEMILAFHGLGEPPDYIVAAERIFWVPFDWFEALLETARRHSVGIAFDDGNSSDLEQALPALLAQGMSARFFPLTGRIGVEGYLDVEDIAALHGAGMKIGSQGIDHRDWRTLDDDELQEELCVSRRCFSEIVGHEVTEAACPFGSYDRRVLRALRVAGYQRVFNSDGRTGRRGAWISPRETVAQNHPLEHWIERVERFAVSRPGPLLRSKRLLKRLR